MPTGDIAWRVGDQSRAHSSRVQDRMLGGKDNYACDAKLADALQVECPGFAKVVAEARAFLLRASRYAAVEAGVCQFLELGCGYSCPPNVHEVVTAAVSDARTVYVDSDPTVVANQRVMLHKNPHASIVWADFTDIGSLLNKLESRINLDEPVAVSLSLVLELVADPTAVVEGLVGALAAGSHVVISHLSGDADLAVRAAEIYGSHGIQLRPRTYTDVEDLVADCALVDPGIVPPRDWHPHAVDVSGVPRRPANAPSQACYAVVGKVG
ncbi:SAM-dependent methyltransferase (plasmid) [Nocardia sp. CA-084685]|uniref:SAM-dependent methyltransferase n=1 Tax=Nocardia sp. CA-084685 TaxID=3239970 RepID=UPI003D97E0D1